MQLTPAPEDFQEVLGFSMIGWRILHDGNGKKFRLAVKISYSLKEWPRIEHEKG